MKKIGLLYGMEQSFPPALIDKINSKNQQNLIAETIKVGGFKMNDMIEYDIILDRVSHEVPFYRSLLKLASINGTRIINNPFLKSADDNFFHTALATKMGINVPKTVILPSKEHPVGTSSETMKNLKFPLEWDEIFNYIGFPAYLKPNIEGATMNEYKVYNPHEFFSAYDLTGSSSMLLQESIETQEYFKCFAIGNKYVKIMKFDPSKPYHHRYPTENPVIDKELSSEIEKVSLKINATFRFEFNAVEFALFKGKPYIVDFLNPAPKCELSLLHKDNFDWLVEATAEYLIELSKEKRNPKPLENWIPYISTQESDVIKPKAVKKSTKKKTEIK